MESFFEPNVDPLTFLDLESPSRSTFRPLVDLGKRSSVAIASSGQWSGSTDSTLTLPTPSPPVVDFSPTNETFPPYSFLFYEDNTFSTSDCHEYYPFEPEADEFLKGYDDAYHGNSFGQPFVNTLPTELVQDLLSPKCERQSHCTQTISPKQLIAPLPTQELSTACEEVSCTIPPSPRRSPSPPSPLSLPHPPASTVCSDPIPVVAPVPSIGRRSMRKRYSTLLDVGIDIDDDEYRGDDSEGSEYHPEDSSTAKSSTVDRKSTTARLSNKKAKAKFATQKARQKMPKKPTSSPSKRRRSTRRSPPPSPSSSPEPQPQPQPSVDGKFKCHVIWSTGEPCPQSFQRNADLDRHLISVHNERQIRCGKCGGTYSRSDALERHVKKGCLGRARKRRRRNYELNNERSSRMRVDEDDDQ